LQRLEREKSEREQKHKKAAVAATTEQNPGVPEGDVKQAAILAALERAKAKKAAQVDAAMPSAGLPNEKND
jgi:Na+-translocating ferredoxin:NAD+ oxidoreductase RnfC subunit